MTAKNDKGFFDYGIFAGKPKQDFAIGREDRCYQCFSEIFHAIKSDFSLITEDYYDQLFPQIYNVVKMEYELCDDKGGFYIDKHLINKALIPADNKILELEREKKNSEEMAYFMNFET